MPSVFPLFNSWFLPSSPSSFHHHLYHRQLFQPFNSSLLLLQFFLRCPFYFLAFISVISYWLAPCSILFIFNFLICSFALLFFDFKFFPPLLLVLSFFGSLFGFLLLSLFCLFWLFGSSSMLSFYRYYCLFGLNYGNFVDGSVCICVWSW